jgi:hypothetical protein
MAMGNVNAIRKQPNSAWSNPQSAASPTPGLGPTPAAEPEPPKPNPVPTPEPPKAPYNAQQFNYQEQPTNVGHDGTLNGQTREQWRDAWMSSGNKNQADTDTWLGNAGATKLAGNGTFMTPYGEVLDLGQNYRSGNVTPAWTRTDQGTLQNAQNVDQGYQGYNESAQNYSPGGVGPSMGGNNSMAGIPPELMTAFQQFLANGGQNQQTARAPRTPTLKEVQNTQPQRSATQYRQGR